MDINIHDVKEVLKGRVVEHTRDRTGEKFYSMRITFIYEELGTCKERYSKNTMWGDTEISATVRLIADTKEALKVKYKALA
jgi:hypothetical protein